MFIQFGYVILFSAAYPLAGLCALVNNLIEIRGDAFKLCLVHKRPFGQRVNSIGSWQVPLTSHSGHPAYKFVFGANKLFFCIISFGKMQDSL